MSADGGSLLYSTYFTTDRGVAQLALSVGGDVYVSATTAVGFPVTANAPQPCIGGSHDIVVAHLDSRRSAGRSNVSRRDRRRFPI